MPTINFSSINSTTTMSVKEFIARSKKLNIELTAMSVNDGLTGIGGFGNKNEAMGLMQELIQRNKLNPITLNQFMEKVAKEVQKTSEPTNERVENAKNDNPGIMQLEPAHDDSRMTVKQFIAEAKKLGIDIKLLAIKDFGCGIAGSGASASGESAVYPLIGELVRRNHLTPAGLGEFMAEVGKEVAGLNKKEENNKMKNEKETKTYKFTAYGDNSMQFGEDVEDDEEDELVNEFTIFGDLGMYEDIYVFNHPICPTVIACKNQGLNLRPVVAKWEENEKGVISFEAEAKNGFYILSIEVRRNSLGVTFYDEAGKEFAFMPKSKFNWLKAVNSIADYMMEDWGL